MVRRTPQQDLTQLILSKVHKWLAQYNIQIAPLLFTDKPNVAAVEFDELKQAGGLETKGNCLPSGGKDTCWTEPNVSNGN